MKTLNTEIKEKIQELKEPKKVEPPKYQGRGTRARLNTAAEKHLFNIRK